MSSSSASKNRPYDLVIYGATGFTGQLAAAYVHQHYPTIQYALAGRNQAKLEGLRERICGPDSPVPCLVIDAVQDSQHALDALAASTRVMCNYAGSPFCDKALPLVQACATHGTCYTDITGEVPLQRVSYDRYHNDAVASGALIIHACGYDSVPSDLGAMLAAEAMQERHGCVCQSMELVAGKSSGGASGGTIATVMALVFDSKNIPGTKECQARGSYALDPVGATGGPDTGDSVNVVAWDPVVKSYVMPFLMARANAPVVRKTNALLDYRYGRTCSYREVQKCGLLGGVASLGGFAMFAALLVFPLTQWLLLKYVLPKPGEGPSEEARENGFFNSRIYAVGDSAAAPVTVAYVRSGNAGDPGYKATACMSIEASLCMALERDKCAAGGVLTTATGLGRVLVDRLNKAGMKLGVEP
jgi:short subunit dehydrogenase-like uncharacterized protein